MQKRPCTALYPHLLGLYGMPKQDKFAAFLKRLRMNARILIIPVLLVGLSVKAQQSPQEGRLSVGGYDPVHLRLCRCPRRRRLQPSQRRLGRHGPDHHHAGRKAQQNLLEQIRHRLLHKEDERGPNRGAQERYQQRQKCIVHSSIFWRKVTALS